VTNELNFSAKIISGFRINFIQLKNTIIMFLVKFETHAYAILRIVVGFLFLWHGSQKLFGFPPTEITMMDYKVWIAGIIEFFGGSLICIGLFTRYAAFISCGEMAYAYWTVHGIHAILPVSNHGELALIFCFIFLFITTRGSGILSFDYYMNKRKHHGIGL